MIGNAPPLSRRDFMTASAAAAGFTLAAGPVSAQAIITDAAGLVAGDIAIPVAGGHQMPGYRAKPANVASPPVIVVAGEIFGLHEHIKDVCRRLGKLGAMGVAPDYYFRSGDVSRMADMQKILPIVDAKLDAELMSDLDATVRWARSDGGDVNHLGMAGFCRGGRTAWLYAAHNPTLRAAVAWYGPVVHPPSAAMPKAPIDLVADMKAPVLGLYGGADTHIPVETVERMREAMRMANKKAEIIVYPDTPHAFFGDYRPTYYRKQQAEDGWRRLQAWFREHGVLS